MSTERRKAQSLNIIGFGNALCAMALTEKDLELFHCNYKLVENVIRKYNLTSKDEYDDLFQEGCLGLLKAINKYKGDRNTKFTTFAYTCIDNEVRMYLRKRKKFFRDIICILEEGLDAEGDTRNEITSSIQETACDCYYNPEEFLGNKEELEAVTRILRGLTPKERDIIFSFYGICGVPRAKQSDIAKKYNVSQGKISKTIKNIIETMKKEFADIG